MVGAVVGDHQLTHQNSRSSMISSYNNILTDSPILLLAVPDDSFSALTGDDNVLGAGSNDIVDLGAGNDSVNFSTDLSGGVVYAATIPSASPFPSTPPRSPAVKTTPCG